jgi:hypothetical protein
MVGSSDDAERAGGVHVGEGDEAGAEAPFFSHAANTVMVDLAQALLGADAGTPYARLCTGRWVPLGIRLRVALDVLADVSRRGTLAIATDDAGTLSIENVHVGMDGVATVRGGEGAHGGAELLWEVLAGEVLRGAPQPLPAVAPDIPRSIVEVVERALAGEMLFTADVLEPFTHAAAALAADREDVRRVVAMPASLPSQRPACLSSDGEAPIDLQRGLVVPALAEFARSQLRTRPAACELDAAVAAQSERRTTSVLLPRQLEAAVELAHVEPESAPPAPCPLESGFAPARAEHRSPPPPVLAEDIAFSYESGPAAPRARRSSRPLMMVRRAPPASPRALIATRRHVDVPFHALVPVTDDRLAAVRSLALVQRTVHAPSPWLSPRRVRAVWTAAVAVGVLALASLVWLPRGASTTPTAARTGVEGALAPAREDAVLGAAGVAAAAVPAGDPAAAGSANPSEPAAPAAAAHEPAAERGQADGEGAPLAAGGPAEPVAAPAAASRSRGRAEGARATSGKRGAPRAAGDRESERAPARRAAGSRPEVVEASVATRDGAAAAARPRPVPAKPQTERAVHEGVVNPGY